jgi:hypothetical protein
MVFYIIGRSTVGFSIISESGEITLIVPNINIQVPIETIIQTNNIQGKIINSGRIKFETENEIVIKDKIAYIR